jgi:hypothetical protein
MQKQWFLGCALAAVLVACGKKEEPVAAAPAAPAVAAAPAEEKVLNIYNWPDYIAKDMVANFEKETGIKVNYQTFESNEAELVRRLGLQGLHELPSWPRLQRRLHPPFSLPSWADLCSRRCQLHALQPWVFLPWGQPPPALPLPSPVLPARPQR